MPNSTGSLGTRGRGGCLRRAWLAILVLLLLPVVLLGGLYAIGGYVKTPSSWWYPFITSFLSDYYTTGPFAMTSNTREDNPVWSELPAFNKTLARMTYAMSRGQRRVQVAWLLAQAEWVDEPALEPGIAPNRKETAMSRALTTAGLTYDRISRSDLQKAFVKDRVLSVGHAKYDALLINRMTIAEPALLAQVLAVVRAGVPVVWQGPLPVRAPGWADRVARDSSVQALARALSTEVLLRDGEVHAVAALAEAGVSGVLQAADQRGIALRLNYRELREGELILLFNETDQNIARSFRIAQPDRHIQLLDPETGKRKTIVPGAGQFTIEVPATRTRLLLLSHTAEAQNGSGQASVGEVDGASGQDINQAWNWSHWQDPPRSMHPYIRWWWPGNAVEADELRAELQSIYDAGYGGVELQTLTIGLPVNHLAEHEQRIYGVGTAAYFNNVKTVFSLAQDLGMTVDLTMGSGWSSGGPFIKEFPEQQLLRASFDVSGPGVIDRELPAAREPWYVMPTNWIIKDTIGEFDQRAELQAVVVARLDTATDPPTLTDLVDITDSVTSDRLEWDVPAGRYRIHALYQNATSHNAVASAYPGALARSPILDHLNIGGIREYIKKLGDPWLDGIRPFKPDALFIDSFELIGELPWSADFVNLFVEMHGYDLTPYLPLVFMDRGESKYVNVVLSAAPAYQSTGNMAQRIREDYEATRQRLFLQAFLRPLRDWANGEGIKLRLQAHGGYGDYLDAYKVADIPEAEGLFAGGSYDFLKLAASAGHVAGRLMVSSESFITMSSDFNALSIEDYYLLAGNAYAAGINRTICHGYAYHYSP